MTSNEDISRLYEAVDSLQKHVTELATSMGKLQASFDGAHARGRDIAAALQVSLEAQKSALSSATLSTTERLVRMEIQFAILKWFMGGMTSVIVALAGKVIHDWIKVA